jgi:hypothetical protein
LNFQELQAFLNLYQKLSPQSGNIDTLDTYFSSGEINDLAHTTNLLKNVREFADNEDQTKFLGTLL